MADKPLEGLRVAALVANDFEQVELTEPKRALEEAGAQVLIVSPEAGQVRGIHHDQPGDTFPVDVPLDQAQATQFDALLLPGGALSPDQLRMNDKALALVQAFDARNKPIAVICHGPWTLVSAGLVQGRKLTSYRSIRDDIINAGGMWLDEAVVEDGNWVSSRSPRDLPDFIPAMVSLFKQYRDAQRRAA